MFKSLKSIFIKKKSHVNAEGERYNTNVCTFCKVEIKKDRFSYHKGMHFHRRCIRKWYLNNEEAKKDE